MPPKAAGSSVDKKQTTLFGFFSKTPAPSSSPSVRPQANGAPSSSAGRSQPSSLSKKKSLPDNAPASSSPLTAATERQAVGSIKKKKVIEPLALLPTPASSSTASARSQPALVDLSEDADEDDELPPSDLPSGSGATDMDVDEEEEDHPIGRSVRSPLSCPVPPFTKANHRLTPTFL